LWARRRCSGFEEDTSTQYIVFSLLEGITVDRNQARPQKNLQALPNNASVDLPDSSRHPRVGATLMGDPARKGTYLTKKQQAILRMRTSDVAPSTTTPIWQL
jgi:hypothetical protein